MRGLSLVFLLCCWPAFAGSLDTAEPDCRYIVRFPRSIGYATAEDLLKKNGFTILKEYRILGKKKGEYVLLIRGACESEKRLKRIPSLLDVEQDQTKHLSGEGGISLLILFPLFALLPIVGLNAL